MESNYKIYRKVLSKEKYFENWTSDKLATLTSELQDQIYQKYLVKCDVFKRDNFRCRNIECEWPESELTMHHIKWQTNGGKNTVRNNVCLCKTCHKGFHRAKRAVVFANDPVLPKHIRGMTFKLDKPDEIDWKKIKIEMRIFRKTLKDKHGLRLSWEQINVLLQWLDLCMDEEE